MSDRGLFGGLAEGLKLGSGLREARQMEKYRDSALRKMQNEETALGMDWEAEGGDPSMLASGGLEDPFLFKLKGWMQGGMKKAKGALGMGGDEAIQPAALGGFDTGPDAGYDEAQQSALGFADGGSVDFEKLAREQERNARREILKDKVRGAGQRVVDTVREAPSRVRSALSGADDAAGKFMSRAPEGAGRLGKAGAALKRGGALGALAATGIEAAGTPTEDYRERFGLETNDPSLLGDIGVRALGAASDLGNAMTFGLAGRGFRDKQEDVEEVGPPPAEEPPEPTRTALPPAASGSAGASVTSRSASPARSALPSRPAAGAAPEKIDFRNVDPAEVPNFKTRDWEQFRAQSVKSAILRGVPRADAIAKVDQQVMQMQQQGFSQFAQQGMMLQESGDPKGAMAAYRAAFQYMPSKTDIKFGMHKGQIVGYSIDEETGQPKGSPMLISPERIAAYVDNFRKPEAWQTWAKDRRDFQQKVREYEETEKPYKEAAATAGLTSANAAATRANADMLAAETDFRRGGSGGMKPADYDRAGAFFVDQAEKAAMEAGLDSSAAEKLYAAMAAAYRQNPGLDARIIAQKVLERARGATPTE